MSSSTSNLNILITGANQGLGFEAAKHLSKHPHVRLFLSGRKPEHVKEAAKKIADSADCQAKIESITLDVSSDESIKRAVGELQEALGDEPLDVLVASYSNLRPWIDPNRKFGLLRIEQCRYSVGLRLVREEPSQDL